MITASRLPRPAVAVSATVGLAALVALGACSSPGVEPLESPPALQPLESTTTVPAPDYAGVRLAGVSGRTRTTVVLGPGRARLSGIVTGPEGPVGGAVVHVERLVGDAAASTDVIAGLDGRWALPGVLGGRYRVRAWRAPDLALLEPQLFFLEATEAKQVGLVVARFGDTSSASAVAPDPPTVGQPANLSFGLFRRVVDDRGTVRSAPVANVLAVLTGVSQWSVVSANPVVTNAGGGAEWSLVCLAPGPQPLAVTVGDLVLPLALPPCVAPAPSSSAPPVPDE